MAKIQSNDRLGLGLTFPAGHTLGNVKTAEVRTASGT